MSDSNATQLADLDVGETVAIARRQQGDFIAVAGLKDFVERTTNTWSTAISRARRLEPGSNYDIESGYCLTRAASVVAVVTVTRTA